VVECSHGTNTVQSAPNLPIVNGMDAIETATTTARLVGRMAGAAEGFLATLGPPESEAVGGELGGPGFREWSYLPGPRAGLSLSEMTAPQRDAALTLLDTGCSATGARTARAVIELDIIRRQLGGGDPQPGDDRFWFRVFGTPTAAGAWAWRVNGHHLAVHVTVAGGDLTVTPSFFGSEPATVLTGPHEGLRVLTAEEDLARALLGDLDEDQRRAAITSEIAPNDILTRNDPVADLYRITGGIAHGDLTTGQQDGLQRLVRHYFDRTPEPTSASAWAAAREAGLDEIRFAWAGGTRRGERHYYSVLGPTFLLEYDNTQDDANHIHSVWRDLSDDWGGDLLSRHYATGHH
jgi:hypothetical protein